MNSTSTLIIAVHSPDLVEHRRPRSARGAGTGVTPLAPHRPYRSRRRPAAWTARRLMARQEKGWHRPQRCAQQIGTPLSCYGSWRTSGPSARHVDTFPLWPGRPCASSARSALRSARVTCPRPSSPRRAQPKCEETVGFNALAHSEDRVPGTRHFALLRPLKPVLHSKFGSEKLSVSALAYLDSDLEVDLPQWRGPGLC